MGIFTAAAASALRLLLLLHGASLAAAQTVTIANGTLQGSKCATTDVNSFLGIPYAQAPVGSLRFAAPQALNASFGTRSATSAAPACVQFSQTFSESGEESEDCLFVDVWVPANASADAKLPVKVWLYGGGNAAGGISNPTYTGCTAATSTIQVSVNYRVGPLGFLSLPSLNISGNQGIQDQLLGLQWVQDNVAAFGGDPSKVLLFGQSAGAFDTFVLSSLPQAPQLMSAAILQSGAGNNLSTTEQARPQSEAFVKGLNCSTTDLGCLQSASLEAINASYTGNEGFNGLIVDGTIIPEQPLVAGSKVPAIAGSTTQEGTLFLLAMFREGVVNLTATDYDTFLRNMFPDPDIAQRINESYPVSRFNTSTLPAFDAMAEIVTLMTFRCPTRQFLRNNAAKGTAKVWTYSFNHTLTCPWFSNIPSVSLPILGSTHTAEIPFVFGGTEGLPRPNGTCNLTDAEKALSARMMGAWDAMAGMGSPGDDWPEWSEGDSMGWNVVGDEVQVGSVDYTMCDFWDGIFEAQAQQAGGGNGSGSVGNGTTSGGVRVVAGGLGLSLGNLFAFISFAGAFMFI